MTSRMNRKAAVRWTLLWATLTPALALAAAAQNITLQAGGPANATVGAPFAFTISLSNLGTAASSGTLSVTDTLDPTLTLNSVAAGDGWGCSTSGQIVSCSTEAVVPPQSGGMPVVSINVTATQVGPGYVRNTATVSGASVGGQNNKTAAPVTTAIDGPADAAPADLSAVTSGPNTGVVGTQFQYTLKVGNSGATSTQGPIALTYAVPAGLAPVMVASSSNFGCVMNGATVNCTSSTAIGAASGNLTAATVTVMPLQPGTYSNTSTVSGGGDVSPANNTSAPAVTTVAAAPIVAPPAPDTSHNYGGIWWGSPAGSESGWGINFAHQADTVFATWYTYGEDGNQVWMVAAADRIGNHRYAGNLYTTTGPAFSARFDPTKMHSNFVGTAVFDFADNSNATFTSTVNGLVMVKQITREIFAAPATTCVYGADPMTLAQATNYQDMWWAYPAGSEAGWGVNIAHQGNTIFATWFTYDVDGSQMWLVSAATKNALGTYDGTLYRTRGPAFNSTPFDPAKVTATAVGNMKLIFADGNHGTFSYTVGGVAQSKSITREVFAEFGTVCH